MTNKRALPAVLYGLAFVATSCQIEPESPHSEPSLATTVKAGKARMHERFDEARRIEDAVVHGDLERAHDEAHALTVLTEPEALPQWRPYLERIWASAHQIELASDVSSAARATATLGRECAHCHQALAVDLTLPRTTRPADSNKLQAQMLGHQWAAARMWDGLIGPADASWAEGAVALTQVSLTIAAEEPRTVAMRDDALPEGDKIGDDIARVRLIANRAVAAHDQDGRAEIFGDLLVTCAHCHAAIRDR